ncbi:hypothetical protein [Enterococcus faecium]|uniref:hypothetical protein n=1 Tax=Enterococcus faecium TaxID=1352 RepID=UPI00338E46A2
MEIIKETKINVGDIYYSSWGYEQTNVTFYQVVRRTEKTVWFQPIKKECVEILSSMSENVLPVPNAFTSNPLIHSADGRLRKRLKGSDGQTFYGSKSWDTLYRFDGQPVYQSSYY